MSVIWASQDAATATDGVTNGDWQATGVSIDTRSLQPGDLFVALAAARDGHDFVDAALQKGAAAALVTHRPDGVAKDVPLLIVPDVLEALVALGAAARARTSAKVVAVTGSVGKTSTKEMLRVMLSPQGKTHAAEASYNNHWGVPLTLARMPADTEFAIIEIGMNHPGEIAPLAAMAAPHVAMVTTVAAVHLEAFESVDAIAQEKASIFGGLIDGGHAIINADISNSVILQDVAHSFGAKTVNFGHGADDWQLLKVTQIDEMTVAQARHHGEDFAYRIASLGGHFAMNALGALASIDAMGADWGIAVTDLGRWQPFVGRGVKNIISLDAAHPELMITLYDDAYNANPASVAAALDVLARTALQQTNEVASKGRRVAVLGTMGELGPQSAELHAELATLPAMAEIDLVHCVGDMMTHLYSALPPEKRGQMYPDAMAATVDIAAQIEAGDVVMVKGSLSTGLGKVVDAIRNLGQRVADVM